MFIENPSTPSKLVGPLLDLYSKLNQLLPSGVPLKLAVYVRLPLFGVSVPVQSLTPAPTANLSFKKVPDNTLNCEVGPSNFSAKAPSVNESKTTAALAQVEMKWQP